MDGEGQVSGPDHPNPSATPVQTVRLRYAKRGRLRFASHRDVARVFERALRRAGVPMALSQGYSPRPKISWQGAVPTGVSSEAEYVELQLAQRVAPEALLVQLRAALVPGVEPLDAVEAGGAALSDRLEVSRWRLDFPGVPAERLTVAVEQLMAAEHVEVRRMGKNGLRTIDAREPLVGADVDGVLDGARGGVQGDRDPAREPDADDGPKNADPYGILEVVVRQTTPAVRPDDVLNALRVVADQALPDAAEAIRLEQGRLDDAGGFVDPFAPDRATAGPPRGSPAAG